MTRRGDCSFRPRFGIYSLALVLTCGFSNAACTGVPVENPEHLCVPAGNCPDVKASVALTDGDPAEGARLFSLHCVTCHGENGKGAKPGVGDLTSEVWHAKSRSAQIAATIRNGRGEGMPAFPLSQKSITDLVAFVRSISAPKTAPPSENKQYP